MKRTRHIVIVNKFRFAVFCCTLTLLCATACYIAAAAGDHKSAGFETVTSVQYYQPLHFANRHK